DLRDEAKHDDDDQERPRRCPHAAHGKVRHELPRHHLRRAEPRDCGFHCISHRCTVLLLLTHRLTKVILHLCQDTRLPPRSDAQIARHYVEVACDHVGVGHGAPLSTAFTPCVKVSHSRCCAANAATPLCVTVYTRRRRPLSMDHALE